MGELDSLPRGCPAKGTDTKGKGAKEGNVSQSKNRGCFAHIKKSGQDQKMPCLNRKPIVEWERES